MGFCRSPCLSRGLWRIQPPEIPSSVGFLKAGVISEEGMEYLSPSVVYHRIPSPTQQQAYTLPSLLFLLLLLHLQKPFLYYMFLARFNSRWALASLTLSLHSRTAFCFLLFLSSCQEHLVCLCRSPATFATFARPACRDGPFLGTEEVILQSLTCLVLLKIEQ